MKSSRMFTELLSMEGKCAAASLFFAWVIVPMFPRPMSLLEVVDLSLQACSNVTHDDVAVLVECCPP